VGPLDAFWHLANFFMPALVVALIAASACKLLWRRELAAVRWRRLALYAAFAGAIALVAGLAMFGRDGKMATYGLLVTSTALALWWSGFAGH
jgi:hypothetical protein